MDSLKQKLRTDLTAAMKAKDKVRVGTLRMAIAAVGVEEVAGDTARELTDAEIQTVLTREVRKRAEAATAFADAGRAESAEQERAESTILSEYLPTQLTDAELTAIVDEVVGELGEPPTRQHMGQLMKAANARVSGRATGARVSTEVKARLS